MQYNIVLQRYVYSNSSIEIHILIIEILPRIDATDATWSQLTEKLFKIVDGSWQRRATTKGRRLKLFILQIFLRLRLRCTKINSINRFTLCNNKLYFFSFFFKKKTKHADFDNRRRGVRFEMAVSDAKLIESLDKQRLVLHFISNQSW